MDGVWSAGTVKRALGCAAVVSESGVHSLPCQSVRTSGAGSDMPSHQTSPSGVLATLVKMVFSRIASIAFGVLA